ncbi:hypothetical protein EHQ53_07655 [Leptospira langatensis]|uniref:Lipoprotein n=1 Tax=Leptospira langatensis TaxID=2484983 RepID=A0A5F1ZUX3_9LEPT|nr:hypothetical protein [Leptospira langatensis]TGK01484.1 hypothetical protein EHO57_11215 [Leptospira langatensis]TGL42066.1 hypothetical protein EHQ53_07655 [Leptospira langatensis]
MRIYFYHSSDGVQDNIRNGKDHLRFITLLALFAFLLGACASANPKQILDPGYVEVEAEGQTPIEAERNAKLLMLDKVLGEFIESNSILLDSGTKEFLVQSSREGFIRDFKILRRIDTQGKSSILASGFVNAKAAGNALEERYKILGKPKILVFVSEKIGDSTLQISNTQSEIKLLSLLQGFELSDASSKFKNSSRYKPDPKAENRLDSRMDPRSKRSSNSELDPNSKSSSNSEEDLFESAKVLAQKENCELLLFGTFSVRQGDRVLESSSLRSIYASFQYKLVEAQSYRVLASDTAYGGSPAIDLQYGTERAREQIFTQLVPALKKKLSEEWKRGHSIRIEIEKISYDQFVDSEFASRIRSLKGVNSVLERGKTENGRILIEVEALFDAGRLYSLLKEFQQDLGLTFRNKEINGNYLLLEASPLQERVGK